MRELIRQGFYFARDPLAATALANPAVVTFRPLAIEISDKPEEMGRTVEIKKVRANMLVAIDADNLAISRCVYDRAGSEVSESNPQLESSRQISLCAPSSFPLCPLC